MQIYKSSILLYHCYSLTEEKDDAGSPSTLKSVAVLVSDQAYRTYLGCNTLSENTSRYSFWFTTLALKYFLSSPAISNSEQFPSSKTKPLSLIIKKNFNDVPIDRKIFEMRARLY